MVKNGQIRKSSKVSEKADTVNLPFFTNFYKLFWQFTDFYKLFWQFTDFYKRFWQFTDFNIMTTDIYFKLYT